MSEFQLIPPPDTQYTCVLIDQHRNIGYFGTSVGCVEIWDLDKQQKVTEVRYLILNSFNDQIPIEDPVVNLAAPSNFKYVYAFMGIAAYCIDTETHVIIQQIPISERVIWGAVSPELGEIGVITVTGYLSRWSPKFYERVGSIEFDIPLERGYILHDWNESRIILLLENNRVILTNLQGERYKIELEIDNTEEYLNSAWYDKNKIFQVLLNPNGYINIYPIDVQVDKINNTILDQGRLVAEEKLKNQVNQLERTIGKRKYISDVGLLRQSRDRYVAELKALEVSLHHQSSVEEDSKTLYFAVQEYQEEDINVKSEALSVMKKICNRNNIGLKYVLYSWKNRDSPTSIIDQARYYEHLTEYRKSRITKLILILLFSSFAILITANNIIPNWSGLVVILSMGLVIAFILLYLRGINTNPKLTWIIEYNAVQLLVILSIFTALILILNRQFQLI